MNFAAIGAYHCHEQIDAGFETGFTFTVKILNSCLVLISGGEDIRAIKQQNQQQQLQLNEIKLRLQELVIE
ncbi:hypothetical protein ACK43P_004211 [Providencia stuartii]